MLRENNYGGVIVFDLSEKFGYDPVDYAMTSQYLEKLLKKMSGFHRHRKLSRMILDRMI